jgi:stage II sporulation protein D
MSFRTGSYTTLAAAEAARAQYPGSSAVSPSPKGLTLCDTAGHRILFEFEGERFAMRGAAVVLSLFPLHRTVIRTTAFFEYTNDSKKLTLVNIVDIEQYVKGVFPNEAGLGTSDDVAKAFSILIRTFGCGRKHSGSDSKIDVCNTSCCQVYRGAYRETERVNKIVDSTKGLIITYNGGLIKCFYNVSNGGASCSSAAAWGSSPIPYLNSVQLDEGPNTVVWSKTFTKAELLPTSRIVRHSHR